MFREHRIKVAEWLEMRELEHKITSATVLKSSHFILFSPGNKRDLTGFLLQ